MFADVLKRSGAVIATLLFVVSAPLTVNAQSERYSMEIPCDEWEEFKQAVPDDIKDGLESDTFESEDKYFKQIEQMSTGEYIVATLLDAVGTEFGSISKLLLTLIALITLSAVLSAVSDRMDNPATSAALRFCSCGAFASAVVYTLYSHFGMLEDFFAKLSSMMNGMIPITASIWAMGGNISTASAGSASFYVILAVCETVWAKSVIPVCCVLAVLGVCDAMSDEVRTGRIMNAVKKIYGFILGIIMTILLASLATQTALAASADSVAARTARFVSGTVIPVVGGSVAETFRTVAGGVSYLKNAFGIGGIIMIALLVIPVGVSVLLTRFVFLMCCGMADMLGCSNEARLLENLGEVYGCMLGVIVSASATFIMALAIFIQTVVAVS